MQASATPVEHVKQLSKAVMLSLLMYSQMISADSTASTMKDEYRSEQTLGRVDFLLPLVDDAIDSALSSKLSAFGFSKPNNDEICTYINLYERRELYTRLRPTCHRKIAPVAYITRVQVKDNVLTSGNWNQTAFKPFGDALRGMQEGVYDELTVAVFISKCAIYNELSLNEFKLLLDEESVKAKFANNKKTRFG